MVNTWQEAYGQAQHYYKLGDQHNASIRLAQVLVILEAQRGFKGAFTARDYLMRGMGVNMDSGYGSQLPSYSMIYKEMEVECFGP